MGSYLLDLYTVVGNQIHGENIKKEYGVAEGWWSGYRERQERKLALALNAVPPKEEIDFPELPRLALGKAGARPATEAVGYTSTSRESDLLCTSSEMRDYFRDSGYWTILVRGKRRSPITTTDIVSRTVSSLTQPNCEDRWFNSTRPSNGPNF